MKYEALPYEIEFELPINVTMLIYSYVTPKYMQTPNKNKILRMNIELNHKISTMKELITLKERRKLAKKKRNEQLRESINNIIVALEKLV